VTNFGEFYNTIIKVVTKLQQNVPSPSDG